MKWISGWSKTRTQHALVNAKDYLQSPDMKLPSSPNLFTTSPHVGNRVSAIEKKDA